MNYRAFVPLLCGAAFLSASLSQSAAAATLSVPAQYATIQAAVNAAANGDTVLVAAGTYTGAGNVDVDFDGKNITVTSQNGAASTIINCAGHQSSDGSGDHRGFHIHSGETAAILNGFTVENGYESGDDGGGMYINNTGTGTVTVSNCLFTGSLTGGAMVAQNTSTGTILVTNCALVGNTAMYAGGGITILNGTGNSGGGTNGTILLTNCTITDNTANPGGGVYNYDDGAGTIKLTNCIVYGNSGGDFVNGTGEIANITYIYSDIGASTGGEGDLNTDPLFVNSPTDLRLRATSPCLGEGTPSGAPTTTIDGRTRPSPPSIGAYEGQTSALTHILWTNTNGTASLWNYTPATGAYTATNYGPYSGWSAKAVAEGGTDGLTRMLWTNTNGTAALWRLTTTGTYTATNFGPYTGWSASAASVGVDNITHLLWNNTNGKAALWNVIGGTYQTEHDFGPYAGWTAKAIANGTDGLVRMLWTNTNGQAAFWAISPTTGAFTQYSFGPYSGWTAKAISASSTTTHVLWSNANGVQSVWNFNPATGTFTTENYGPYSGWAANALADGGDGKTRLLWDNTNGTAAFWDVTNTTGAFSAFSFGPYGGWTATAISAGE